MVGNIKESIENIVSPGICSGYPTRGAESTLSAVRDSFLTPTTRASIVVAAQDWRPTGQHLSNGFQDDWPDPLLALHEELVPMVYKDVANSETDLLSYCQHAPDFTRSRRSRKPRLFSELSS